MRRHRAEPCDSCPYRRDVRPFLRPERGAELALLTRSRYADFICHKTLGEDEDGSGAVTHKSQTCAGFLSMMVNETGEDIKGFTPSPLVYGEPLEMIEAYEEQGE